MRLIYAAALALLLSPAACGDDDASPAADAGRPDAGPKPFDSNGILVPATAEGLRPAGKLGDGTAILPGGRKITPAGQQLELGGFLLGVRVLPGAKHAITTDGGYYDNYLSVVRLADGAVVQREPFKYSQGRGLFLGLAERDDGHIFASGGGTDKLFEFSYNPNATGNENPLTLVDEVPTRGGGFVAGLAFVDATRVLVAYQASSDVALLDSQDGTELGTLGLTTDDVPYDVVVDRAKKEAYVSLWGTGKVAVINVAGTKPTLVGYVTVGKNPSALLLTPPADPKKLLVAATDSDRVDVIDLSTHTLTDSFSVAPQVEAPRGSSPNHLAVSPDGTRLYVANAGENCVDVFATSNFTRLGRIPTAWYPTATALAPDGTLYITNAKGMGGGPSDGDSFDFGIMKGTLEIVPAPSTDDLTAGVAVVEANNRRMRSEGAHIKCPAAPTECLFPLPPVAGLPTPIEHIVLIVRENKTYDATLGDLGTDAKGDPSLVLFGEKYTPNLHALARAHTNGDNFYANAEASIQGHAATTMGRVNDFTEKAWLTTWGRSQRTVAAFGKRISAPEEGSYFQHLGRAKIPYMTYGESLGFGAGTPEDAPVSFDSLWPGGPIFNTKYRERDKALYFRDELSYGQLDPFTYILLPNNHTNGLSPGAWTPEFMVADNDEATGMIVEDLAKSPFWYSTIIFIIEDDPQDGADHVEAHRSTLVVISPWVKRGYTSKVHYDVASLWATIELLLGLTPRSQVTADAAPMFDIFTTTPDYTPYVHIPSKVPEAFNKAGGKLAEQSLRMDFSTIDNAPGLGRLLWEHMKGTPAPWASMPLPLDYDDEIEIEPFGDADDEPGETTAKSNDDDDDD